MWYLDLFKNLCDILFPKRLNYLHSDYFIFNMFCSTYRSLFICRYALIIAAAFGSSLWLCFAGYPNALHYGLIDSSPPGRLSPWIPPRLLQRPGIWYSRSQSGAPLQGLEFLYKEIGAYAWQRLSRQGNYARRWRPPTLSSQTVHATLPTRVSPDIVRLLTHYFATSGTH